MKRKVILNRDVFKNKEKWKCPRCYSARLAKDGTLRGIPRFRCKNCNTVTIKPKGMAR